MFLALTSLLLPACLSVCLAEAPAWDANSQGQFITSLCRDDAGHIWIGTEDNGVWRWNPDAPRDKQYTHFITTDGLGDNNAYALACDQAGRIWAGTLNHGVSVYNGKTWKTYGPVDGPLGSRIFALAVNPVDGGVWGATEAGLFRYQNSRWTYFTRADGLPSDQANALAFGSNGTLYVGTQCDGIAIASSADDYKTWRTVPGPAQMPNAAEGDGLPSALINCLLVTQSGTVYAGTTCGLAASRDHGVTWRYQRGVDWKAKLAGLYHPTEASLASVTGDLLSEDYVTCLAEDGKGRLFVGHRQTGLEAFDPKTGKRVQSGENGSTTTDYIFSLLLSGQTAWVGLYGGGLLPPYLLPADTSVAPTVPLSALPVPAKPPTLAELRVTFQKNTAAPQMNPGDAAYLGSDWATRGDWVGRYGTRLAILCAAGAPFNHEIINDWTYKYGYDLGPNRSDGDSTRHWIQWLHTSDPRVLYDPVIGDRRESEWDDHGETYSQSAEGPDMWVCVSVPAGVHRLTSYFVNKDGHDGPNRYRDYLLTIFSGSADPRSLPHPAPLASARVHDFWGGVYQSFAVRGPSNFYLHVSRNNSFNTILSGLMLDKLTGPPTPLEGVQCTYCKSAQYAGYVTPPAAAKDGTTGGEKAAPLLALWSGLDGLADEKIPPSTLLTDRILCYRTLSSMAGTASSKDSCNALLSWWRRSLPLVTEEDRQAFLPSMASIYAAEVVAYPEIKNIH